MLWQSLKEKIQRSLSSLRQWQSWPPIFFELPVDIYAIFLALKYRISIHEITDCSNPGLEDELYFNKYLFTEKLRMAGFKSPASLYLSPSQDHSSKMDLSREFIKQWNLSFPIVMKPASGGRGSGVRKIRDLDQLNQALAEIDRPYLLQEFISYPIEIGVFYIRQAFSSQGTIIEVTEKQTPTVTGNGKSSIKTLIEASSFMQKKTLISLNRSRLDQIPKDGLCVKLSFARNQAQGGIIREVHGYNSEELSLFFDRVASALGQFHYGRFDVLVRSPESLLSLIMEDFVVLEANGVGSGLLGVFTPGVSFKQAVQAQCGVVRQLYNIIRANRKRPQLVRRRKGWKYLKFFLKVNY